MISSVRKFSSILFISFIFANAAGADDHRIHDSGLHFSHPLVSESPTPDSKIRADYALMKETDEEDALIHRVDLIGEYAPARWVSVEIALPYTIADRDEEANRHNLDNMKVALKLANFAFEDEGLLLGGGLEVGLPTGNSSNDIGSDRLVEIEPFVDFGLMKNDFELVGFLKFGFPANENSDDPDWELGWNASLLYHATPWLEPILEFDGERVWGGEEDGETVAHVSPGLKLKPLADYDLKIGTAISLPITNDEEFDLRWILSVFYHF
jgi:hypothetical protein